MRSLIMCFIMVSTLFGSHMKEIRWSKGETFLTFLESHKIPMNLYFNLPSEEKELCAEIIAGISYQVLYDNHNTIQQVLIPISEEMQIHIKRNREQSYDIDFIPIYFEERNETLVLGIQTSPYQDIINATSNYLLANEFSRAFKKSVDFRRMRPGNKIAIQYKQKIRNGVYFGMPIIQAALVQIQKKTHSVYMNEKDGRYYDHKGRSLTSFFMKTPVRYTRISDGFTYKRFHPILKKYRAHLGIDYAAPTGRPIVAAANGKVIHKGNKGGYGKTVMIQHKYQYRTLYAHMHRYKRGLKIGQYVKQGQTIGYVGSTGMSTGPHLHFGLYKNSRAIDPAKVITVTKNKLQGKAKKKFLQMSKKRFKQLQQALNTTTVPLNLKSFPHQSLWIS